MIKLTIVVPLYNQEELILKTLDSIEKRQDIEIIIIDDCSTDNSFNKALDYIYNKDFKNIKLFQNKENLGVGLTINKGLDNAIGEYVGILCDDDYLIEPLSTMINELDGSDLIYYNLRINNGEIWKLDNETKWRWVGATKLYKRSIIGKTRRGKKRIKGDWDFFLKIMKKNPTEKFTNITLYHYNYPRVGSLIDKINKTGV